MHRLSSKYRAPVGRPSKRKRAGAENIRKRYLGNKDVLNKNTEDSNYQPTSSENSKRSTASEKNFSYFPMLQIYLKAMNQIILDTHL